MTHDTDYLEVDGSHRRRNSRPNIKKLKRKREEIEEEIGEMGEEE